MVMVMTIYVDIVFLLNFAYDFLLLLTVDITLKRHSKLKRVLFSSFLGALSLGILFIPLNQYLLFGLKIITSILMVLIAFGYKDIKYTFNNIFYLYMCSVILGGFLYYLNVELSYKNVGLVFFHEGLSINYIVLLIIAPLILGAYIYQNKRYKKLYNYTFEVKIVLKNNKEINCKGFLDSGNKLKDPLTNKYIILVEKCFFKPEGLPIYVPFRALNKRGLVECFAINYIEINHQRFKNYLVGIAEDKFNIEGVNCLLNNHLLEEICFEK